MSVIQHSLSLENIFSSQLFPLKTSQVENGGIFDILVRDSHFMKLLIFRSIKIMRLLSCRGGQKIFITASRSPAPLLLTEKKQLIFMLQTNTLDLNSIKKRKEVKCNSQFVLLVMVSHVWSLEVHVSSEAVLIAVGLATDRAGHLHRHTGLVVIPRYVDIE